MSSVSTPKAEDFAIGSGQAYAEGVYTHGTTYQNTSGRSIVVGATVKITRLYARMGPVTANRIMNSVYEEAGAGSQHGVMMVVPDGFFFKTDGTGSLVTTWVIE